MIFIDPEEIEEIIPDELKQRLQEATAELRALPENERAAYIRRKDGLWRDVRPYLAAVTGRARSQNDFKCWYCEEKTARFTYHVDHFRPKGRVKDKGRDPELGYWWLAFDYRNYLIVTIACLASSAIPHTRTNTMEKHAANGINFHLGKGALEQTAQMRISMMRSGY
jgi:hypothetical protein